MSLWHYKEFSFKHSLVPAIQSHLKSQSLEFKAQQPVVMEMNVRPQRARAQKASLAGKEGLNEIL